MNDAVVAVGLFGDTEEVARILVDRAPARPGAGRRGGVRL